MSNVRNLVVACDGTWNDPESSTNVKRFKDAVFQTKEQVVHYEKGVGTGAMEALPGGVYGHGLDKRIVGAYAFLRRHFEHPQWKNKIFLVGFSRGAYTARRISGLLAHSGMPRKADDLELGWELYKKRDKKSAAMLRREGRFYKVPVQMVGVWDTVKATNDADYHDNELATNVVAGYHAMAIDERRKFFPVLKWKKDPRIVQVWFAGVHSDVGGGYKETGLSDIALRWMMYRAMDQGLDFREDLFDAVKPRSLGKIHESLTGFWHALGERRRSIGKTELVHPWVGKRLKKRPKYHPENLPATPRYWSPDVS